MSTIDSHAAIDTFRHMRVLVVLLFVSVLCGWGCKKPQPKPEPKPQDWKAMIEAWQYPDPIPAFELVAQTGKSFRLDQFKDHFVLFGFVFSRCPQPLACPLTMKKMSQIQTLWKQAEAQGKTGGRKLQLIGVTFDPDFDTPPVLTKYLKAYGGDPANWIMATGPADLVNTELPSLFNVMAVPDKSSLIRHSVKIALLRPGLTDLKEWPDNKLEPKDVIDLILATPNTPKS